MIITVQLQYNTETGGLAYNITKDTPIYQLVGILTLAMHTFMQPQQQKSILEVPPGTKIPDPRAAADGILRKS